ncbi:hypothetical protein MJ699_21365 [Klebsiella pneumoniae]|nr:hypothetical protein MJ699_21365 [Klebsiella pneumoniae]
MEVIREELELIRDQFGDERRTEITANSADINIEDLINQEDVVVTLSHQGYVKYQPLTDYEAQRRGGKGKSAARIKEEDFIDRLLVANTHDTILSLLKPRPSVLDEGLPAAGSQPRRARSADRQPAAAGSR